MIVQYELPWDVPEHGLVAGDVLVFHAGTGELEFARPLPTRTKDWFASAIPRLRQVGPRRLSNEVAVALVRAHVPPSRAERRLQLL